MDKSTLSNYGWVVIVTLVLAVMLALATPFGSYVGKGASNVIKTFVNTSNDAIDEDNIDVQSEDWDDYLNDGLNESGVLTRESDNYLMCFSDGGTLIHFNSGWFWEDGILTTKIIFEQSYPSSLTVKSFQTVLNDQDYMMMCDDGIAVDVSLNQDEQVVMYMTQEGEDKVMHIAGKDGVVMANEDSSCLLSNYWNVKEINFNNSLNTSKMRIAENFFDGCYELEKLDITTFNVSSLEEPRYMFASCKSATEIKLPSFENAPLKWLGGMFFYCESLEYIDLSTFNTENVVEFTQLFCGCKSLKTIDVSMLDTSKVESFQEMFSSCETLTKINLSTFDTKNATNFANLFSNCTNLKEINISSFDTRNATTFLKTFKNCTSLEVIYANPETCVIPAGTNTTEMWENCKINTITPA